MRLAAVPCQQYTAPAQCLPSLSAFQCEKCSSCLWELLFALSIAAAVRPASRAVSNTASASVDAVQCVVFSYESKHSQMRISKSIFSILIVYYSCSMCHELSIDT